MGTYLHTGVPRVSDPTPYEYLLWDEHLAPPGYGWCFDRTSDITAEFSFKLHLRQLCKFSGDADTGLALSLRKWAVLAASIDRLAAWLGPDQPVYIDEGGYDTCALCQSFMDCGHGCFGCAIFEYTRVPLCDDTPYVDLHGDAVMPICEWQDIADREVEFLTMLRTRRDSGRWEGTWPPKEGVGDAT